MTAELSERKSIVASIRRSAAAVRTMLSDIRETTVCSRQTIYATREALVRLDRMIEDGGYRTNRGVIKPSRPDG